MCLWEDWCLFEVRSFVAAAGYPGYSRIMTNNLTRQNQTSPEFLDCDMADPRGANR